MGPAEQVEHVQRSWENLSRHRRALLVELWTQARLEGVIQRFPHDPLYDFVDAQMRRKWKQWTPKTQRRLVRQLRWVMKWQPKTDA